MQEAQCLLQLQGLLARAQQVALLASSDFAGAAAELCKVLEARHCGVIAGIEGAGSTFSAADEGAVDVVVLLGPCNPGVWGPGGPLQAAARLAVAAAAASAPVFAVGGDAGQESPPGGPKVIPGGVEAVRGLAERVAVLPAETAESAARRWQEVAEAVRGGSSARVAECLELWPEMRARCDAEGRTLLHLAAAAAVDVAVVEALLHAGVAVPLRPRDAAGRSPGDAAFEGGSQEVVDLLVTYACAASANERLAQQEDESGAPAGEGPASKRPRAGPQEDYLHQHLLYEGGRLLDAKGRGVMMGWESPLMAQHAEVLLPSPGGAVLNVGFGLGLVDGFLQGRQPRSHTIIEAHRDVLAEMERLGWGGRPGVVIRPGRWQDVVDSLPDSSFDAVFFDTWQETYDDLLQFFRRLPRLLRPRGRFSFFNGLAPYSVFEHATFCRLAQQDLGSLGLQCHFRPIELGALGDETWQGVTHRYWQFETYYLPLAFSEAGGGAADLSETTGTAWRSFPTAAVRVQDKVGPRVPPSEFGF